MKYACLLFLFSIVMGQLSFAALRGYDQGIFSGAGRRKLSSSEVASNEDISKFLQYNKNIGSSTKPRVRAVGRGIFTVIFGGMTYYLNKHKDSEWDNIGLGAKVFAGFTARAFWDLFDALTFEIPYQDHYATSKDGLVQK